MSALNSCGEAIVSGVGVVGFTVEAEDAAARCWWTRRSFLCATHIGLPKCWRGEAGSVQAGPVAQFDCAGWDEGLPRTRKLKRY